METDFANIEGMFKTNTDIVKKAIDGILPGQWFLRPGDDSNHLMWVAGHLVVHRGAVLKSLGAEWETSLCSWNRRADSFRTNGHSRSPANRRHDGGGDGIGKLASLKRKSIKSPITVLVSP